MKVNDFRGKQEHLSWDQLQAGEVYVDNKYQIYVMSIAAYNYVVDLHQGILYLKDDYEGVTENFIHYPNAVLEIK